MWESLASLPGQERDGGTEMLDYFNARHFSAYVGGFMQADPGNAGADILQPQSWNGYGYVLGNPLGLVDPSGMALANPGDPQLPQPGQPIFVPGGTVNVSNFCLICYIKSLHGSGSAKPVSGHSNTFAFGNEGHQTN